jgi:ABC-type uncharacterized transport system permease subunit
MPFLHISSTLVSYAMFLAASVSGALFLLQERQIKRKRMGVLFHRLPSLEQLERMNVWAIGLGFVLLTLGLGGGLLQSRLRAGAWWTGDVLEVLSATLWGCYLVLWLARLRQTMRGRRVAWLSVGMFCIVLVTCIALGAHVQSWHPALASR